MISQIPAYNPLEFLQGRIQIEIRKGETTQRWIIELSYSHSCHHVHILIQDAQKSSIMFHEVGEFERRYFRTQLLRADKVHFLVSELKCDSSL